jgi:colicin import membrane protein
MTSYFMPTLVSFAAHGAILFLIFAGVEIFPAKEAPKPPAYIKATLVDLKPQGKQGAEKVKPKPKKIDLQKKRQEQERLQKQAEQQKIKIAKKKAEEKRKKEAAIKKKKEEEQRKKQQQELRQQAEKERKKLEQQQFEENLAKERERIEAEQKAEALAQQVEDDKQLSQSYFMLIQQTVTRNWSRPPSARNGMETLLSIQLIPTGEVIDVSIAKSSGNAAFDRAAVQAVKKAGQFDLKNMPSRIFEREYRQFKLLFNPQDRRQ